MEFFIMLSKLCIHHIYIYVCIFMYVYDINFMFQTRWVLCFRQDGCLTQNLFKKFELS